MPSLKPAFDRATAIEDGPLSLFWMLVWAVAIDDDRQRREKERQKKREQAQKPAGPKPPAGPRP